MINLKLILEEARRGPASGWTGWVAPDDLKASKKQAYRPWCRGRARGNFVEWFPRTSKPPWEGTRWAVPSPEGHLPGLTKAGWFVVNAYTRTEAEHEPDGRALGVMPTAFLDQLYEKLSNFYWDAQRGSRR